MPRALAPAALKPRQMDERGLRTIVTAQIRESLGFLGGELASQRREALEYYYGEPFGNEVEGRSQVVLTDVADTVEWVLPSLLKIFTQNDRMVKFEPQQLNDKQAAEQATEAINYIFTRQLDGFMLVYQAFKDALLQKSGIFKSWWDDSVREESHKYGGISQIQLFELEQDPAVVVEEVRQVGANAEGVPVFDVEITRTLSTGRLMCEVIPPEEFLISKRAVSLEDAVFVGHRSKKTVTELLEMGFDEEKVMRLHSGDGEYNQERTIRHSVDEDYFVDEETRDPSMREVWIYETYPYLDWDGDGKAELRKITLAGTEPYELLENEEWDERPFDSLCPIPMPHKFYGRSLADTIKDLQLIRSTILRQQLDNMYLQNNARTAVNIDKVPVLDDFLYQRVGGVVRTRGDPREVVMPLVTPPLANDAFKTLEYMEDVRATRTGITRYNQGLDADSLNDTATGVSKIMAAANQRIELIARVFAESGLKPLFARHLRLLAKNQSEPLIVRLRDDFLPMDPKTWNTEMDVSIEVGLGYENKEQEAAMAAAVLDRQFAVVQYQGGVDGPLVTLDNLAAAAIKFTQASGLKHPEQYWTDPQSPQAQQALQAMRNRPNPEVEKAKLEKQEADEKLQLERYEIDIKDATERYKIDTQAQIDVMKIKAQGALEGEKLSVQAREKDRDRQAQRETEEMKIKGMKPEVNVEDVDGVLPEVLQVMRAIAEGQQQANQATLQALSAVAQAMSEMASVMAAPKRVVKDEKGEIVGSETVLH